MGAVASEAILLVIVDVNGAPVGVIFKRTVSTGVKAEKKWIRLLERRHWRGKRYIVKKEK